MFLVNGKEIYTAAAPNLWYRLRFELDTKNKVCTVKVNGREAAKVDFASSASSISGLVIENNSDTAVYFDNFRVFRSRVPIVARSYAKVGSIYYYGESKVASMKDVAARLLENENASEEEKQFAQDILDKAELTVE